MQAEVKSLYADERRLDELIRLVRFWKIRPFFLTNKKRKEKKKRAPLMLFYAG